MLLDTWYFGRKILLKIIKRIISNRYFECACARCTDEQEHVLSALKCAHCGEAVILFGEKAVKNMQTLVVQCGKCGVSGSFQIFLRLKKIREFGEG
jgi:predicted RNA-binding Zn-ribbon protein involved in translation (DUF1610 family)